MVHSPLLACVVILYNPESTWYRNLLTFLDVVDKVYVIDNSETSLPKDVMTALLSNSKCNYTHNSQNQGIAKVLNTACNFALLEGYKYILTMDQDSYFESLDDSLRINLSTLSENVAILYPQYTSNHIVYKVPFIKNNTPIVVMTSGNILSLNAYKKIGGFDENLFVDYVDFDICLRLHLNGYIIKSLPRSTLNHKLGNTKSYSLFGRKITVTNHSSIRRYYITRNRFYIAQKLKKNAPWFGDRDKATFINDMLKILFFESGKVYKLINVLRGYIHYREGKFGKTI